MKNFFLNQKFDTYETYDSVLKADLSHTCIEEVVEKEEMKKLTVEIYEMMPAFLDIFHMLQAGSESFPLIEASLIMKKFLMPIEPLSKDATIRIQLENILRETCIQNQSAGIAQHTHKFNFNRSLLLEAFFRIA